MPTSMEAQPARMLDLVWPSSVRLDAQRFGGWLDLSIDCGIACSLFGAPLFMGGRFAIGHLVFVTAIGVTSLLWCIRQHQSRQSTWVSSGAEWVMIAGLALVAM